MKNLKTPFALAVLLLAVLTLSCGDDDDDNDDNDADDDLNDDTDDDANDDVDDDADDDTTPPDPADAWLGVWYVYGNDDELGPFSGQVEIRRNDKTLSFHRSVKYDDLAFSEYEVYSGWEGTAALTDSGLEALVELRRVDFIKSAGDLSREGQDTEPEIVALSYSMPPYESDSDVSGAYASEPAGLVSGNEVWTWLEQSGDEPIFHMDDAWHPSHTPPPEPLKNLIFALLTDYHALEFYDDYRDKPEFDEAVHYFPRFRTDFAWYRENPGALRVPNKVIDDISMTEAMLRARAYSQTLSEKAELFDQDMPDLFINPSGMISQWKAGTQPPEHQGDYDSSLWTGTYVASQFFRWDVTGEPEALDNALNSLDAMFMLPDIPDDPAMFARTMRLHQEDAAPPHPASYQGGQWYQGVDDLDWLDWQCCGNNDMLEGVSYAYAAALFFLQDQPDYDQIKEKIGERAVSLLNNCDVVYGSDFDRFIFLGLAYLATGDEQYRTQFDAEYSEILELWIRVGNGEFYAYGVSDWSGQHLNTVSMIAQHMIVMMMEDQQRMAAYESGWIWGMRLTNKIRYVLWPIAGYAFGQIGDDLTEVLDEAVWGLRETPYPKEDFDIDFRVDPDWCASPLPSLFWKFDWEDGGRHQGLYAQPYFRQGATSCAWKDNPLKVSQGPNEWRHNGADYLHAYWLGRWGGLISDTQSE